MPTNKPIQILSTKLDPIRDEFATRIYHASLAILDSQIRNDASLFWRSPSRIVQNLKQILGPNADDRIRVFLICHGYRNQAVLKRLNVPVPSVGEEHAILEKSFAPFPSDVARWHLLPLHTPRPRIDQRKLNSAIRKRLGNSYLEIRDPNEPARRTFSRHVGPWQLDWVIVKPRFVQVSIELDISIGMGPLSLARQLSLTGFFGVAGHLLDLTPAGDEEKLADYLKEYTDFMMTFVSGILTDLDPQITPREVADAEKEWNDWLKENRARRIGP